MHDPREDPRYREARQILDGYSKRDSTIDMGNLAYAIGVTLTLIDELREERDQLRAQNADLLGQLDGVVFAHNVMQAERDRLREALEVYANKRNWNRNPNGQLCNFHKDRNGPYIAMMALQEAGDEATGGKQ